MTDEPTAVCVVGGGPAGLVLGLGLARAGIRVTVLEKHADFLRDFRGDTVHASTLTLLDELGLGAAFDALPQRRVERVQIDSDAGTATVGDLTRLPGRHRHIALVPQWDLLELLARAAAAEPTFTLRREAEVVGLLRNGGRVTGVRWRDRRTGAEQTLSAGLTVACDGRDSAVRHAAGLRPREFGVPMDVEWFRLPRRPGDRSGLVGRVSAGRLLVMIDRGDSWQCAYLIRKGADARLRAAPIQELRDQLAELVPLLADRTDAIGSWDDVRLLVVTLNRLRRWWTGGLLLIGDAAHAMSPVGGVGINLAVQDAVAATRIVGGQLRAGRPAGQLTLLRVQLRRWWPTALVQAGQRVAHRALIGRSLNARPQPDAPQPDSSQPDAPHPDAPQPEVAQRLPLPVRLLDRFPALRVIPAYLIAIGPLPEHAPAWARRPGPVNPPERP